MAKILLSPVNSWVVDAPTNHLGLSSKQVRAGYEGTLLLISYDRYFLDKLVPHVLEVKDRRIRTSEGNYSDL